MQKSYIYSLSCPSSGAVRYIGKAKDPEQRLLKHLSRARNGSHFHCANWIRSVISSGALPVLRVILEVPHGESWEAHERRLIAEHRLAGCDLTNMTDGGEGLKDESGMIAANIRSAWAAKMADPIQAAAHAAQLREMHTRPGVREAKRKKSAASWAANRELRMAALNTPEAKARHIAARRASCANPEVLERIRSVHRSPEVRAKHVASAIARATPEYRAMMAAKTAESWIKRRAKKQESTPCPK